MKTTRFENLEGELITVRADELSGRTTHGWQLIAIVPDTVDVPEWPPGEPSPKNTQVAISWFVLQRSRDEQLNNLRYDLDSTQNALNDERTARRKAEKDLADLQKEYDALAKDVGQWRDNCKRAEKTVDHVNEQRVAERKEYEEILDGFKALLSDADVNDALIAAITAQAGEAAKQMLINFMQLRTRLDA